MTDTPTPTAIALARAIQSGAATIVAAETLSPMCDCMNSGAAWPDTQLVISSGAWRHVCHVWLMCYYDDDGAWTVDSRGGGDSGEPRVEIIDDSDDDAERWAVRISGGDNIGGHIDLAAASEEDAEEAAAIIGDALDEAYAELYVKEPAVEDIDVEREPPEDSTIVYVIDPAALTVVEVDIREHRHLFERFAEAPERHGPVVWSIAGIAALAGARYDSGREAREALADWLADQERELLADRDWLTDGGSTPSLYDDETAAAEALHTWLAMIVGGHPVPDGWTVDHDDPDGLCLEAAGGERYHPDSDDLRACLAAGSWAPAVEAASNVLGLRSEADRSARRAAAEAALADHADRVWVTVADSLCAGNCARGTQRYVADLRQHLGADGEIGAATAAAILAHRDDTFTRRACLAAAMRREG